MAQKTKLFGAFAVAAALSACDAPVVGPSAAVQREAIFECAKTLGEPSMRFTILTRIKSGPSGQIQTASLKPNDTVSAAQAAAINACAAASLGTQGDTTPVTDLTPQATPAATPIVRSGFNAPVSTCPKGSAVMRGGSQYCVGLK